MAVALRYNTHLWYMSFIRWNWDWLSTKCSIKFYVQESQKMEQGHHGSFLPEQREYLEGRFMGKTSLNVFSTSLNIEFKICYPGASYNEDLFFRPFCPYLSMARDDRDHLSWSYFFLVASYKFSEKVLLSMIKADCPWTIVPLCILVSLHFPISFSSHCRWTKKWTCALTG